MTPEKLSAILAITNPSIVYLLMSSKKLTSIEATKTLYCSELYETLENESSKLWHLSPLALYELLEEELNTGSINYPEEV